MVPIAQSSTCDLSQGSLRNRNNEIIIPLQQHFTVLPHLSETYHHKINHVVDRQHVVADIVMHSLDQTFFLQLILIKTKMVLLLIIHMNKESYLILVLLMLLLKHLNKMIQFLFFLL